MLITDHKQLVQLCHEIRDEKVCGFDTEFVFERTYWPQLGLVQISAPSGIAGAIDPLEIENLGPLFELLLDDQVKKIVHAGGMDWKILLYQSGRLPKNIFDTQIAASFLGYGQQIGYSPLVESMLGEKVDKTETYTDWLKRPLTDRQIEYAITDVTHLLKVQQKLDRELEKRGRQAWAQEEFEHSIDPDLYRDPDPQEIYLNIRRAGSLGRKELAVLREIAAWREIEARARNVRPHFILKDDILLAAARRMPRTESDLSQVRGIHPSELKRSAPGVLAAVQRALKLPDTEWPTIQRNDPLEQGQDASINLLQSFVQMRAREVDTAPETLCTKSMLKMLVKEGEEAKWNDGTLVLKGWRKELLGPDFLDLLTGRKAIGLDGKSRTVRMYPVA